VTAKRRPAGAALAANRPGKIDYEDRTGSENGSQLPVPATVASLPIIGAAPPDWSRSVLTESQANVESNLFRWRKLIIAAPHLRPNAKLVALVVADRCGDKNECAWPSLARLEDDTSLARSTILRAVTELEARGFLAVARKPGQSNRYYPAWPAVMEAEWLLRRTTTPPAPVAPRDPTSVTTTPDRYHHDTPTGITTTPEVSLEVAMKPPSSAGPAHETTSSASAEDDERENELRQTRKGAAAARFSDHFNSPDFTFWNALEVIERFESDLDLNYGIEPVIHRALGLAQRPQYVINALEMAAGRHRAGAA
jgi:hypothetical protein